MRNIKTLIVVVLSIFSVTVGCNSEVENSLPPCNSDVISQNTEFYFNQNGTLTLVDTVPNYIVPIPTYFINSEDVSYLPLEPCNLPLKEYNVTIGDTIDILFSGNLMLISPTGSSAGSLQFELTKISRK